MADWGARLWIRNKLLRESTAKAMPSGVSFRDLSRQFQVISSIVGAAVCLFRSRMLSCRYELNASVVHSCGQYRSAQAFSRVLPAAEAANSTVRAIGTDLRVALPSPSHVLRPKSCLRIWLGTDFTGRPRRQIIDPAWYRHAGIVFTIRDIQMSAADKNSSSSASGTRSIKVTLRKGAVSCLSFNLVQPTPRRKRK